MAPSAAATTALVFSSHPQLGLAAKSSLAAGLAWLLVQPFGGVADDYPYYAPLGAVVAVSTTVSGSARTTLQALVSIGLGAALGALAGVAPVPTVVGLVVVVAVAGLVAGWRRLGLSGSWVPVSALFVLVLGGGDPTHYLGGYLGLMSLGMLVGTAVNLALPQTVLAPAGEAEHRLRGALADQLDDLADGLLADEAPEASDWRRRRRELGPLAQEARILVDRAMESRRGNWRARGRQQEAEQAYDAARALERLASLVGELFELVSDRESREREAVALGPELRPATARALRATADVVRDPVDADRSEETLHPRLQEAAASVAELARAVRRTRPESGTGMWTAATVVTTLERALAALTPGDPQRGGPLTRLPGTDEQPPPSWV
jgi:uncharacterized membrane protein YgaE (UPF0421/DUF939 family)